MSWETFESLSKIIVQDIISNKFNEQKICLLGVARGGLPLLTYVSHHTELRDISIFQAKMTKTDEPYDYGDVSILLESLRNDFNDFIIFEDIVFKGKTIEEIQLTLQKKKKNIKAIYSLTIDEKFNNLQITNKVRSASLLRKDSWIIFPWEKKVAQIHF